jgi:hypothetical protein
MKLGIIGYVPPPSFGNPRVFIDNLARYKHDNELLLYSDYNWPDTLRLKGSPESIIPMLEARPDGTKNKWAVNNFVFLTGLALAARSGFTHIIYLESDCRVGKHHWDSIMFEEHFALKNEPLCSGTLVCWNPMSGGMASAKRWNDLICKTNKKRNFPIPTYGVGASVKSTPSIFPIGALGIYDMTWMQKFFDLSKTMELAAHMHAWDFVIGDKIWAHFGLDSYDQVGNLQSVYSSFGDQITTEEERLGLVVSGKVTACHQVKSTNTL